MRPFKPQRVWRKSTLPCELSLIRVAMAPTTGSPISSRSDDSATSMSRLAISGSGLVGPVAKDRSGMPSSSSSSTRAWVCGKRLTAKRVDPLLLQAQEQVFQAVEIAPADREDHVV